MESDSLQRIIEKTIEEVASEVCDKLCKYRDTRDDDCVCDYMREHGACPLERL